MVSTRWFVPRQREAEREQAQERKTSRGMSPWAQGKTLEGAKAQEGIGRKTALIEVCLRYGSAAGAKP